MGERRAVKTTAVLWCTAVVIVVVGCVPEPAPTPLPLPTATGFASDEEAFAAAEATYRAYIDAVNAGMEGQTAPDPIDFLVGTALEGELKTARELEDMGLTIVGQFEMAAFKTRSASATRVESHVCLNVGDTRVLDLDGRDVTPQNREELLSLDVTFDWSSRGALVSSSNSSELPC